MDSLFDQLKSAPAVNAKGVHGTKKVEKSKATKRSSSPITKKDKTPDKIKKKKVKENSTTRRDSMPPPASTFVTKVKAKKYRSLSPPKDSMVKQFKVLLERKKLDEPTDNNKKSHKSHHTSKTTAKPTTGKATTAKPTTAKPTTAKPTTTKPITTKPITTKLTPAKITSHKLLSQDQDRSLNMKNGEKTPKKATPTKAQQKLFDPAVLAKAKQLKQLKVKCCKVRIKRQNLKKLQREFHAKNKKQMKTKILNNKKSPSPSKQSKNFQLDDTISPTPAKRGRPRLDATEPPKTSGFFIKINDLTKSPKLQKSPKSKIDKLSKDKKKLSSPMPKFGSSSVGSLAKRINAAAAISSTKPTKFTRTQLIKMYGKRVFCTRVKIERCSHPMMLIFESNARARRLQSKRSKSKNLSVSFREQVEIFGDSSSDSEEVDTSQMFVPVVATTSQAAAAAAAASLKSAIATPLSITATPARLKKVENGKVVDDIELDPSLFVAPTIASTPYPAAAVAARKKRDKKSFSPLKGDGAPSPRKEQLKLANEKMPPSSLRRLTENEVDEEEDEDDECEYIVPIDIPDRRTSRTSSANAFDEDEAILCDTEPVPQPEAESTRMNISDISANISSVNNSSAETFASAVEQPNERDTSEPSKHDENNLSVENVTTNGGLTDSVMNEDKSAEEQAEKDVMEVDEDQEQEPEPEKAQQDLPKLIRIASESPSPSFNSLNYIVDTLIKNVDDDSTGNVRNKGNDALDEAAENINNGTEDDHYNVNDVSVAEQMSMPLGDAKSAEALNDDASLQMFVDDDSTTINSTFLEDTAMKDSEIVDGIVKERIDEISAKDKQLNSANEATTQNNLLSSNVTAE